MAIVKNAPMSNIGICPVKNTSLGILKYPISPIVLVVPEKSTIGAMPATVKMDF